MKKILIIEDEKNIRNRIVDTLELADEQYDVFTGENGRIGLEMARRELPDLIISDVMMPEMDGYEVLKLLRADEATSTIPFIFLSAKADIAHIREGMNLGADDYLPKPFSIDELLRVVSTRLQRQETQERRSQQELDSMRIRIANSLPHEFRTPLSGIIGFTEMLRNYRSLDEETVFQMLDQMRNNAERLQRLVENFLMFSQFEVAALRHTTARLFPAIEEEISTEILMQTLQEVVRRNKRQADIQATFCASVLPVSKANIAKILEELLDNACKFSSAGTPVSVQTSIENAWYVLTVADKGRGMSEEEIEQINAYMQFDREIYEQQGMGLGLALVQRIVAGYSGEIVIASMPKEGTTVTVKLPMKKP